MEHYDSSDNDIERDPDDTTNKVPGDVESRVEIFQQEEVPIEEIRRLLRDLKG